MTPFRTAESETESETESESETETAEDTVSSSHRDRLARVLADAVGVDPTDVVEDATFRDDLDVDSLTMVEVLMALEEEFGVALTGTEAARRVVSVGDALDLVAPPATAAEPA